ncbi:hypothetical protein C4K05_0361 [Pseudomonas chlororaphis subsp. aureofaciens]|uniref:hypothetical protein n=1 Tax=Pseudomonas chlororaphis TaxID=587753 RepID=UPI000F56FA94|nr:hypothetical protein [Pseudomonas chlororaphis]AZE39731.1 hypothetical protein C4K05_0361 [Pseudomonas chlororaphis subsp. aureofaciens]
MSTLSSSFSPTYATFNTIGYSEEAGSKFDVMAYIEWAVSCGVDVLRMLKDLVEGVESSVLEAFFRPSYKLADPSAILYATAMHENIAKDSYIESISSILGAPVSGRLTELSQSEAGWDGGDAAPMSIESLSTLETFIQTAGGFSDSIGFFLGYEGEILINWVSEEGELIDMAFFDGVAEIYSDEGEARFSIDDQNLYKQFTNKNSIHA